VEYKPEDLEIWDEKICKIAKEKYSLDWFPIEYELIDYFSMLGAMAFHGLPSHFNHWSFGKSFERTQHMYDLGMEGLPYELILNSNPSLAYLMRENPLYLQILIMAHCVGHSDFFKNNRTFRFTRPETIHGRCRAAKRRFQGYVENPNIGIEKVEEVIDACYSVQFQAPKPGWRRRTKQQIVEDYLDRKKEMASRGQKIKELDIDKKVLEPDYDILGFIAENGDMPEWKRDIIEVCRDEAQYFWPQMMTKIMNEGWASVHHYDILHELDLPPEFHLPFIKSHNQVIRPHVGGINPYHLGFHMFKRIKEKYGEQECLLAREVHNDASFIRQYLDEETCVELNLFSYAKRGNSGIYIEEVSDKDGWKKVRDDLAKQVGGGGVPIIKVVDVRWDGTLMLDHDHDGRDLLSDEAGHTVSHLKTLWGKPVFLMTVTDNKECVISK